jgi:hypothetical protein
MKETTPPKIKIKKSPDFKQIYCIGANGGFTPFDFRIGFYNDIADIEESTGKMKIDRTINTEVIMSPVAAKSLVRWLSGHIAAFEKQFGTITIPSPAPSKESSKEKSEGSAAMWT